MQPYQLRVVIEKAELDIKIAALRGFLATTQYEALTIDEKQRMRIQLQVMEQYSTILGARIDNFLD